MGFGWVRHIGWGGLVKILMGHFCPFPRLQNPRGREGLANQPPHMPQVALRSTASTRPRRCRRRRARLQPRCRIWRRALVDVGGLARPTPHGRWEGMERNSPREQTDNTHGWDVMWWTMVLSQACNAVGVVAGPLLHFSSSVMLLAAVWAIGAIFHQWGIFLFDEPSSGSHAPFRCGRAHPSGPFHPDRPMKWKTRPQLHVALHPARLFCLFFCWGCRCGCSPRDRHCTRPRSSSCGRLDNAQYGDVSHRTA
jgi:hypothetical protein